MNATIKLDWGEDLYIHPIAVHEDDIRKNKIMYFDRQEFLPQGDSWYFLDGEYHEVIFGKWKVRYYLGIGRWVHGLAEAAKTTFRNGIDLKWFFKNFSWNWWLISYHAKDPVIFGESQYRCSFWTRGQPSLLTDDMDIYTQVVDNEFVTNNWSTTQFITYLPPSQKYMREYVAKILNEVHTDKQEKRWQKIQRREYERWYREMKEKGCKIIYFSSLNT